ncbi:NAD(P)-dependent oxidoreductase [Salinarimonas ramus]|uniref:6-phosphogluconate dehydrogenase n=1 Tax=Salinarimonas ramus TaxID=690164 RepID=A0A917Q8Y9_9HYPH|nr:NAD(P)-dependent oxidoreductase [Salinarimonas ramus]GGK35634.1 6-phosphogluconate dehydrogenase [Salinarimonas ramus]
MSVHPRVGVVGLGRMGAGIARVLDEAGLLHAVRDLDRTATAAFGEARGRPEALHACDVLLFATPTTADIETVLDVEPDLLQAVDEGRVLVDLTTSHPRDGRRLAARVAARGAGYLDAAMTGGAAAASSGTLTLMVGGEAAILERARPALDPIARTIVHVGPVGAGQTMKLVHNMICHTIFLATAEGCRAAERAGIPLETALAVINAGNARSFVSERRFPDHVLSGRFDGRSRVANLDKDLAMGADLIGEGGRAAPYARLATALLSAAREQGMAEEDFTRLYPHYDALAAALEDEPER